MLRFILAVAAIVLMAAVMRPAAAGSAPAPSPWDDADKPVASFLFTQEDVLARLSADLGLSGDQVAAVRESATQEAAALAQLKHESETAVQREDLDLSQKQEAVASMDYNDRVKNIIATARAGIEAALMSEQLSLLPGWVAGEVENQRRQSAASVFGIDSPATSVSGTYRVYATQYYSNFGSESVDVAVPDKYAKFASLGWEYHSGYPAGADYSVNLGYNGRQLNGVQVKDCGPWNIDDNYWNSGGERPRRLFAGLGVGVPEAQAAYYDDYNGGRDQFDRIVTNPAGIDLSPKAGVALGLGYLVSGWVTVSFNWESGGAPPTIPIVGAIKSKHAALGGAPGLALTAEFDVPGGRAQNFTNGRLIWHRASGNVWWLRGAMLSRYDQTGGPAGPLGFPISDEYDAGGGRAQNFELGRIYWSQAYDARVLLGAVYGKFLGSGGVAAMGLPTSDESDIAGVAGGRMITFQRGRIYWSQSTDAHTVYGGILGKFAAIGGPQAVGMPVTDEYDAPGGRVQGFTGGRLVWHRASGGTWWMHGAILSRFDQAGGLGVLGYPVSDEYDEAGGRAQNFELGRIYWSLAYDARVLRGGIYGRYAAGNGPAVLGLPTSDESDVPGLPGARVSTFERGHIYWSQSTDARMTYGAVLAKYAAMGGPRALGLPVSDEYDVPGGRAGDFQIGRIYWSQNTGAHHVVGGILQKYVILGGPAALGFPISDETDVTGVPGARTSSFERGSIFWHPSRGTFVVQGAIATKYQNGGGPATLGLPTSDETDVTAVTGARVSTFERGRVYWSLETDARMIYGGILGRYLLLGGPGSALGLPVSDEYGVPGGRRNDFQGGYIIWDYSSGNTDVVLNGS